MKKKTKNLEDNTDLLIDGLLSKITPELQEEIDYRMDLAAKIYAGMKAKGWNQTTFAQEMGKKNSIVSRWLSGTHNFETDTLFKIQRRLNIKLLNTGEKNNFSIQSTKGQYAVDTEAIEMPIEQNDHWENTTCKVVPFRVTDKQIAS